MASLRSALTLALVATLAGCNLASSRVSNEFGKLQYRRGNYTAARGDFQRATLEDPENADYWHNLAATLRKQGDLAGAELTYRRALTANPSHQPSYHGLADLLSVQGRHGEAAALLTGWLDVEPYTARPYLETAWLQQSLGDTAGAERTLWQALKVQPSHPTALAHLGQIYQQSGRPVEAVAMYRRSLFANWNQPEVHSRLASLDPTFNRPRALAGAAVIASQPMPVTAGRVVSYGPLLATIPAGQPPVVTAHQPLGAVVGAAASFESTVVAPTRTASVPAAAYIGIEQPGDADPAHANPEPADPAHAAPEPADPAHADRAPAETVDWEMPGAEPN